MPNTFHQRCKLALTHPVTLGAVALLLVNDWLLKPLWQSDWTTGKLSDFAWMVFAPPLLLFVLSLAARGNARAERSAFFAAYAGLPLLYAAYNTFAPLHDWIMGGFMVLSGASAGSPLDPFDSLVIPPAMAVALWVWRQSAHSREGLRTRLHLYAVVIAALATVATSGDEGPNEYSFHTGKMHDVTVVQGYSSLFRTDDGGLTWVPVSHRTSRVEWGDSSVETPRGTYRIKDGVIVLISPKGDSQEVYTFRHLSESSNQWFQSFTSMELRSGGAYRQSSDPIVTMPYNLTYDSHTGNVIVGMGTQGVVVGDTDEEWRAYPVGIYTPTDFSFFGKARQLLSVRFWLAGLTIVSCFMAGSLAMLGKKVTTPDGAEFSTELSSGSTLALLILAGMIAMTSVFVLSYGSAEGRFTIAVITLVSFLLVGPFLLAYVANCARDNPERYTMGTAAAILGGLVGIAGLPPFQWHLDHSGGVLLQGIDSPLFFLLAGLVIAVSLLLMYFPKRIQLPAVAIAFVAMNVLLPLPFLLWLAGGVTLWLATLGAAALLTVTAFALYRHLVRQAETEVAGV